MLYFWEYIQHSPNPYSQMSILPIPIWVCIYIYIYIEDNCPNSYTWKIYPIQHRDMGCWWISNQEKNRGIQMVGKLETMPLSTIHLINSGNQHNTKITYAIPIISSYLIHNLWIRHDLYIYICYYPCNIYIYMYIIYPLVNKHSYWTWPLIVDLPIKNGDSP